MLTRRKFIESSILSQIALSSGILSELYSCTPNDKADNALNADAQKILKAVMDEIIPSADGMPSASETGGLNYLLKLLAQFSEQAGPYPIDTFMFNGVGSTPRLLLNSKSNSFPDGLANSNGLVGRNFMTHPAIFGSVVFEEELDSHLGPMGNPLMSQQFYETDPARGFVRGYSLVGERTFGPFSQRFGAPMG